LKQRAADVASADLSASQSQKLNNPCATAATAMHPPPHQYNLVENALGKAEMVQMIRANAPNTQTTSCKNVRIISAPLQDPAAALTSVAQERRGNVIDNQFDDNYPEESAYFELLCYPSHHPAGRGGKVPVTEGTAMLKYIVIAVLLASSAAQATPAVKKDIEEAVKREQRIKELAAPPRSAHNICRGC
jgi:hypothetical protein